MTTPPPTPRDELDAQLTQIEDAHTRVRAAQVGRSITHDDLQLAVEGFLLRLHASMETFLRDSFLDEATKAGPLHGQPRGVVEEIVYAETTRLDWLPVDKTVDRSLIFLPGGLPFTRIKFRTTAENTFYGMHVVRNRIAHPGEEALLKYNKLVGNAQGLATPSLYLLDKVTSGDRFEGYLAMMRNVMDALTDTQPNLAALGVAQQLDVGALLVRGEYQCTDCQVTTQLPRGKAPACTQPGCGQAGQRWAIVTPN